MMKNKDLQTLEMLRGEFDKSVESAKVPLKLQKQSIVHMLEQDTESRKAQENATENKKYQVVTIKKLMAIAAALAITVSSALMMNAGNPVETLNITNHNSGNVLNKGKSYGEFFEDVVLNPAETSPKPGLNVTNPPVTEVQPTVNHTENVQTQTPATTVATDVQQTPSAEKENVLSGYIYKEETADDSGIVSDKTVLQTSNPEGVSKFEDFEADITREDGENIYVLTTGKNTEVVRIINKDKMEVVSEIPVSSDSNEDRIEECVEIYLQNGRLITVSEVRSFSTSDKVQVESIVTVASYYDITNPADPVPVREHIQDGEYVSSRLCEGKFYLVTLTDVSGITEKTDAESIFPGTAVDGKYVRVDPDKVFYDNMSGSVMRFTYVTVTDVSKESQPVQLAFFGGGKDISCHADTIVISKNFIKTNEKTGAGEDGTLIYRFNVKGDGIRYANQVSEVDGKIVGGIHIDEKKGNLRTVTVSDGSYNVYVFNKEMECVDTVEDVLSGENVKIVKYIGNRVYLVCGENGEKTSIIDFSKKLKAEDIVSISDESLSNSLYEITDSVLLGIGYDESKKIILTLFDFSNPENFRSTGKYEIPSEYTIAAGNDGRCVMADSEKKIFGIPVIKTDSRTNNDVSLYLIFSIEGGTITLAGECIHDDAFVGDAAVRCVCVNDIIYTVSGGKIVSHSTEDYKQISKVEF